MLCYAAAITPRLSLLCPRTANHRTMPALPSRCFAPQLIAKPMLSEQCHRHSLPRNASARLCLSALCLRVACRVISELCRRGAHLRWASAVQVSASPLRHVSVPCNAVANQVSAVPLRCNAVATQCRRYANPCNAAAALCLALATSCCATPKRFCSTQCRCGAKQCQQCRRVASPCHSWLCHRNSVLYYAAACSSRCCATAFPRFAAAPSACCRTRPRPSWRRSRGR